jgi:hypothetical protein
MADLPHQWRAYARIQLQLSRCTRLGYRAWGLEAGLNFLLRPEAETSESELERTMAAAARRHRYQSALIRRDRGSANDDEADPRSISEAVGAQQALRRIRSSVSETDWFALTSLAEGSGYADLAEPLGTSIGALRVRVFRVRNQLYALVA